MLRDFSKLSAGTFVHAWAYEVCLKNNDPRTDWDHVTKFVKCTELMLVLGSIIVNYDERWVLVLTQAGIGWINTYYVDVIDA